MTRALRMQAPINLPVDQCNVEDGGKGGKINKIIKKKKNIYIPLIALDYC